MIANIMTPSRGGGSTEMIANIMITGGRED